jgi:hypothetical protein
MTLETNTTNSEPASGSNERGSDDSRKPTGRPEGVPEGLVERSYFDATLREEREKRQRQRDEFERREAELNARLSALEGAKPSTKPGAKPEADRLAELERKQAEFDRRAEEREKREKREGTAKAVLERVPEGNRGLAQDVFDAMITRGDLVETATPEEVLAAIRKRQPALFVDPNDRGPRSAPQHRPDGSVDWSRYTHPSEVPRELIGQVPPPEYARMRTGGMQGGRGGGVI